MKTLPILCLSMFSISAMAQNYETTVTKDQFLQMFDHQISMQAGSGGAESMTHKMMREHMTEEQFQTFLNEEKKIREARDVAVAECAGVSAEKVKEIRTKATPSTTQAMFKQCADKLPDTITLGEEGISSNPQLADFSACVDQKSEKEFGIKASKLEACEEQIALEQEDW